MEEYKNGWVNYICDKCGKGRMQYQASVLCVGSMRVTYRSTCDDCGFEHNMLRRYPQKIEDVLFETKLEKELYEGKINDNDN